MPPRKQYEPRCPAVNCTGGYASRLTRFPEEKLPLDVLEQIPDRAILYNCNYCGLVWFQRATYAAGFEPTIIGKYDAPIPSLPLGFVPLTNQEVRSQNTKQYWDDYAHRLEKRRTRPKRFGRR